MFIQWNKILRRSIITVLHLNDFLRMILFAVHLMQETTEPESVSFGDDEMKKSFLANSKFVF